MSDLYVDLSLSRNLIEDLQLVNAQIDDFLGSPDIHHSDYYSEYVAALQLRDGLQALVVRNVLSSYEIHLSEVEVSYDL